MIHREVGTLANARPDVDHALIGVQRLAREGCVQLDRVVPGFWKEDLGLKIAERFEYNRQFPRFAIILNSSRHPDRSFGITPHDHDLADRFLADAIPFAIPCHRQEFAVFKVAGQIANRISPKLMKRG